MDKEHSYPCDSRKTEKEMTCERATLIFNNNFRHRTNIYINEKYCHLGLKQINVKTKDFRGLLMVDCGITLATKTYFEGIYGPEAYFTVIRTINVEGSEIVKDFSNHMEFHTIQDERFAWLDIKCLDAKGCRVDVEGDFVLEMY